MEGPETRIEKTLPQITLAILLATLATLGGAQAAAQDEAQIPLITPQITVDMEPNVSAINKITWSPQGDLIAVGYTRGHPTGGYALAMFDGKGTHLWTLDNVASFMFLPEGDKLLIVEATGEDTYALKLISAQSAEVLAEGPTYQAVNVYIWRPAAGGKYALVSTGPLASVELKLIDLNTLEEVKGGEREGSVLFFDSMNWRFSILEIPSLNTIVSSEDFGALYILPPRQDPQGRMAAFFYTKDDKFFLTTVNMETGEVMWEKELTPRQHGMVPGPSLAWSPDGSKLAVLTEEEDGDAVYVTVLLIDPQSGDVLAQSPRLSDANLLSWSPDGKLVATTNVDEETLNLTIVFIDAETGNIIAQTPGYEQLRMEPGSLFNWENSFYHDNMVYSSWAPNGRYFVAVDDYFNYVIVDPMKGTLLGKIPVTELVEYVSDFRASWKPSETEALIAVAYNNWSVLDNVGSTGLSIIDVGKAVEEIRGQQPETQSPEQATGEEAEQTATQAPQEQAQSEEASTQTQTEAGSEQEGAAGESGAPAQQHEDQAAGAPHPTEETVTETKEVTRTVTIGVSSLPSEAVWGLAALLLIVIVLLLRRRG